MRKYELLYLLKHDSPPEKTIAARGKVLEVIENNGGMVIREDIWGKRKLAFEVKKYAKGIYILVTFLAEPTLIKELERNLKIHGEVLRYLTVKLEEEFDVEAEKAERERWQAEDKIRKEEEAKRLQDPGYVPEAEEEEEEEEEEKDRDDDEEEEEDDEFEGEEHIRDDDDEEEDKD